jgi:uncharacterized protein
MQAHKRLIEDFYTAFNQLDAEQMIASYHDEVVFWDPVFENLDAPKAKAMWKMLCGNAKDFSLDFRDVKAGDEYGSCNWVAVYTFSKTGRQVINDVKAHFKFHEGKIVEHMDDFDLWKWSRQALGTSGWLFGWTPFIQRKIRKNAKSSLKKYIRENKIQIED